MDEGVKTVVPLTAEARPSHRRSARIQDVARLAGVSTATVSRVLASPERVQAHTRERVLDAVRETNYAPNSAARSLRLQKTRMVLVVVPDIGNPFFSAILRGIEGELSRRNFGMVIGNLDASGTREARLMSFASAGHVDGALLLNGRVPTFDGRSALDANLPLVTLCEEIPLSTLPHVGVDNRASAQRLVEHLIGLGHRRIGYVAGPEGNVLEAARRQGYMDALEAASLAFDPAIAWAGDYTLKAGVSAGAALLDMGSRPTAVFCSNDEMAMGLVRTLVSAGVSVPGDVSVAGFDDIEVAGMMSPALTTMRQPRHQLGQQAAAMLLDLMEGTARASESLQLATELVVRESTGPVRLAKGAAR